MLCDRCRRREANVHMTQIVNGMKMEENLCAECARADASVLHSLTGGNSQLARVIDILRNIGMVSVVVAPEMTRASVLGEEVDLESLGLRLPGSGELGNNVQTLSDVGSLRAELNAAVAREDFEKAAELRDEIFRLEH